MRPIAACAEVVVESTRAIIRSHRNHPTFPAQWFTAYTALSPATGLFCHRRPRKLPFANLMPASGHQDHTSLPSASTPFVYRRIRVHRIPPHVRDDRETPLETRRDGESYSSDLGFGKTEIFLPNGAGQGKIGRRDWRTDLPVGLSHTRHCERQRSNPWRHK
jgi:hypothetical protein